MRKKARVIAFYLPQFHPIPENDEWWGKGFTEWTNVGKAKPLFRGHEQPRVPADLGYYDLRLPIVRELQAKMARDAGIEGFCYWHYWFNGHELMEHPFWEVVQSGKPDYPFCIGWANETWKSKMWNKDGSLAQGTKILIEQTYSIEDDIRHFNKLLSVFKDRRYILVDNCPLVFVHRGKELPRHTIEIWNKMAIENGFSGIHFVGRIANYTQDSLEKDIQGLLDKGYSAVTISRLGSILSNLSYLKRKLYQLKCFFRYNGCRMVVNYQTAIKSWVNPVYDIRENIYTAVYPNWDHSPRSGKNGLIVVGNTPSLFKKYFRHIVQLTRKKSVQHRIIFLKSWNEWGEGNYVEPDSHFGNGYLQAIRDVLNE